MASGFFFLKYSFNSYLNLCCQTFSASLWPGERIWLFIFVPMDLPFSPCRLVSVTASSWHFWASLILLCVPGPHPHVVCSELSDFFSLADCFEHAQIHLLSKVTFDYATLSLYKRALWSVFTIFALFSGL